MRKIVSHDRYRMQPALDGQSSVGSPKGTIINYRIFLDGRTVDSFLSFRNASRRVKELRNV